MRRQEEKQKHYAIYAVIWSNIRRHQYLLGMTNAQLCTLLGISSRTLYTYDKDPSGLTLEKIEQFLEGTGIEMQMLLAV